MPRRSRPARNWAAAATRTRAYGRMKLTDDRKGTDGHHGIEFMRSTHELSANEYERLLIQNRRKPNA